MANSSEQTPTPAAEWVICCPYCNRRLPIETNENSAEIMICSHCDNYGVPDQNPQSVDELFGLEVDRLYSDEEEDDSNSDYESGTPSLDPQSELNRSDEVESGEIGGIDSSVSITVTCQVSLNPQPEENEDGSEEINGNGGDGFVNENEENTNAGESGTPSLDPQSELNRSDEVESEEIGGIDSSVPITVTHLVSWNLQPDENEGGSEEINGNGGDGFVNENEENTNTGEGNDGNTLIGHLLGALNEIMVREIEDRISENLNNLADSGAKGAPPAAKSVISGLPTVKILTKADAADCAICQDVVGVGDLMKKLPCGHGYHGDCIVKWLGDRNSCPVCRFELPTDDVEYEEEMKSRRKRARTE